MCVCIILDNFIPVLIAVVVLGLVSSVPSQEIDWEGVIMRVKWAYLARESRGLDPSHNKSEIFTYPIKKIAVITYIIRAENVSPRPPKFGPSRQKF